MSEIDIRHVEEATAHMLPAQETVFEDGWMFRFNTGVSRNTNAVWPLTAAPDGLESRIESCERAYAERGLPCNFRLTPLDEGKVIESFLLARGYTPLRPMIVMTCPMTEPADGLVGDDLTEIDLDAWLDLVRRINDDPKAHGLQAKREALTGLSLPVWYTALVRDGRECSYGRSVQHEDLYQLAELFTVAELRGQGLGTQLIHGLTKIGREAGARTAYDQGVTESNTGARRLYERLGYRDAYRFHYMTPP